MFQLLQQLSESLSLQQFKTLMLRIQQECIEAGIDVKLEKIADEDGPSSSFTASKDDVKLKMHLHTPNEWLGGKADRLAVLAIDWEGTGDYDVDGDCVFEPVNSADVVQMVKQKLGSLEE